MSEERLDDLFASAMSARRREDWPEARAAFVRMLEVAGELGATAEVLVAQTHLALIDGDRDAAEAALAGVAEALPSDSRTAALGMLVAESWPAEPRECETHLVARATTFRQLCATLPGPDEVALELGASTGLATRRLAERSAMVYAVEKSPSMADNTRRATAHLPNVRVITAGADEPGLVRAHVPAADAVCLDIGGSTPTFKVLQTARVYIQLYQPRLMVLRCVELNNFVAGLASSEPTYGPSIWKSTETN